MPLQNLALVFVFVLGALLVGWYLVGNEVMRRRGRSLALWCKRSLDPLGGRQAIQWITTQSFRLEVEGLKAPFVAGSLAGLVESMDVPVIWLANRANGRRDMVLLQLSLRQQPVWGLELYRPRSVLAADARKFAIEEGWTETALDGFRLASAGGPAMEKVARELMAELGDEAPNLIRLAVRRRGLHLTLALNIPELSRLTPERFFQMVDRLGRALLRFATPAP
ncbi:MAG TPA: hypothetical protein VKI65_19775 [Gemmataceae bacterium]|nr:hypothetical protein [Gemmataceae bacterium]